MAEVKEYKFNHITSTYRLIRKKSAFMFLFRNNDVSELEHFDDIKQIYSLKQVIEIEKI